MGPDIFSVGFAFCEFLLRRLKRNQTSRPTARAPPRMPKAMPALAPALGPSLVLLDDEDVGLGSEVDVGIGGGVVRAAPVLTSTADVGTEALPEALVRTLPTLLVLPGLLMTVGDVVGPFSTAVSLCCELTALVGCDSTA
jgi:hypothetical protein